MKIVRRELERSTIDDFADKHGLVMEIHERSSEASPRRWYAHFFSAEVSQGNFLCGTFGDGPSEEDAVRDYAKQISGKLLVINAMEPERREIPVPVLIESVGDKEKR